jgi:myosin-5
VYFLVSTQSQFHFFKRVVFQPETERNYHIFYQLCAGIPQAERKELALASYDHFHYLRQGGTGTVPNVDDAAEFEVTARSLSTIGIPVSNQWKIFRVLAAILHIGNIQIKSLNEQSHIDDTDVFLENVTRLLGVPSSEFKKWLVKKQISMRTEKIVSNLSAVQAVFSRDAVAKYIYHVLFDWLVKMVNESLSSEEVGSVKQFIGVLDIYGFEHFKKNSFEQFCINYANEKLQQEFNQHVFKLEQEVR